MGAPSCPVDVSWDHRFLQYEFGLGHPFTERSRRLAVSLLLSAGYFREGAPARRLRAEAPAATTEALERFHHGEYLEQLREVSESGERRFLDAGDTPSFPGCFEAASRIVGATVAAARLVQEHPEIHALQPSGGLHHARPATASGFCILNDVACAIADAFARGVDRVAYVDIDVHHGDGVMYGFYGDARLLDLDVHQDGQTLWPGTGDASETGEGQGKGLKVNAPLAPGAGDRELLRVIEAVFLPRIQEFRPRLIVLQTGVDGCAGDPLAGLRYSVGGYRVAVARIHAIAHEVNASLLATGGGGYVAANVSRALAGAALELAGGEAESSGEGKVPEKWREEFRGVTGERPPTHWLDLPRPEIPTTADPHTERLIARLRSTT
ncbi:MAG: acetoin utilization protein AcuC [Thermoplasmata archaeon]|nr:acetoin utilization protein AcuC [Thermoplasmata archaeon]MCI4340982.1 acetoin utilization protein AcuC [Thermoplasmata archaeon]